MASIFLLLLWRAHSDNSAQLSSYYCADVFLMKKRMRSVIGNLFHWHVATIDVSSTLVFSPCVWLVHIKGVISTFFIFSLLTYTPWKFACEVSVIIYFIIMCRHDKVDDTTTRLGFSSAQEACTRSKIRLQVFLFHMVRKVQLCRNGLEWIFRAWPHWLRWWSKL